MRHALLPVIALLLTGCATAHSPAEDALRRGDNAKAVMLFEEMLGEKPDQLDAIVGLGVASYRLRAFADAIETLEGAASMDPAHPPARIFLGLAYLRKGNLSRAEEELSLYRQLAREPRAAAQVDQALRALAGAPSAEQRASIAASLEGLAESERDRR